MKCCDLAASPEAACGQQASQPLAHPVQHAQQQRAAGSGRERHACAQQAQSRDSGPGAAPIWLMNSTITTSGRKQAQQAQQARHTHSMHSTHLVDEQHFDHQGQETIDRLDRLEEGSLQHDTAGTP